MTRFCFLQPQFAPPMTNQNPEIISLGLLIFHVSGTPSLQMRRYAIVSKPIKRFCREVHFQLINLLTLREKQPSLKEDETALYAS